MCTDCELIVLRIANLRSYSNYESGSTACRFGLTLRDMASPLPNAEFLRRGTPPHILTLVLMAGVGSISMNIFLPSLPGMAVYFETDYAVMQLAISAFLAMTAVLQLIIGPLADRYGRRPVLIVAFILFLAATLGCIFAQSAWFFLLCRMIQAVISSGVALSRAIVRDIVPSDEAASMIGYVTMGMALMPMLGPMIGGVLDHSFGWQATFVFLFLFGAIVLAVIWRDLDETNPNQGGSFREQVRSYPDLFRSRRFWGYTATAGFGAGCFFAFLGGGPYVASEVLQMSPRAMGLSFGIISFGYFCGNFLSGRYSTRVGVIRMMTIGTLFAASGMMLSLMLFIAGFEHPLSLFGCIFFVGLGNGLTLPSANAGMLSVNPKLAGTASGLGGAVMIGGGAMLSAITGALLGPGSGAFPLILMMLASAIMGIVAVRYTAKIEREVAGA